MSQMDFERDDSAEIITPGVLAAALDVRTIHMASLAVLKGRKDPIADDYHTAHTIASECGISVIEFQQAFELAAHQLTNQLLELELAGG